jgi:hypothetical protein
LVHAEAERTGIYARRKQSDTSLANLCLH